MTKRRSGDTVRTSRDVLAIARAAGQLALAIGKAADELRPLAGQPATGHVLSELEHAASQLETIAERVERVVRRQPKGTNEEVVR